MPIFFRGVEFLTSIIVTISDFISAIDTRINYLFFYLILQLVLEIHLLVAIIKVIRIHRNNILPLVLDVFCLLLWLLKLWREALFKRHLINYTLISTEVLLVTLEVESLLFLVLLSLTLPFLGSIIIFN